MLKYKKVIFNNDYEKYTFEEVKAQLEAIDQQNIELWMQAISAYKGLLDAVTKLYGEKSNEYNYFSKRIPVAPYSHAKEIERVRRGYQAIAEKKRILEK